MSYEFRLPRLSETMEEATIARWLKRPGEPVTAGDPLLEAQTDKATVQVEAPRSGVLAELLVDEGGTARIGQVIARFQESEASPGEPPSPSAPGGPPGPERTAPAGGPVAREPDRGRIPASPAARRLAEETGVDLAQVVGTGPGGRITVADVERAAAAGLASHPTSRTGEPDTGAPPPSIRTAIVEQVSRSHREIPSFWVERWADVERPLALREEYNRTHPDGPRITFTDFLLQAITEVLQKHPRLRTRWVQQRPGGGGPLTKLLQADGRVGLVVSVPGGLLVPTLPDLAGKSLVEIARLRAQLVEAARAGRLPQSALDPAPLALSNVGASGADRFQAIIYPGQTAILAVGRVHARAVARGETVAVRRGCYLTLSVDHRVVDGLAASAFIGDLAERIEGEWPRIE